MEHIAFSGKRIVGIVIALFVLFSSNAFAIDERITSSGHKAHTKVITAKEAKNNKYWEKGYYKGYASGFTKSEKRHYSNVKLYFMGSEKKQSGRKWGTGKVSVKTAYWKGGCAIVPEPYGSAVFYGF